MKRSLLVFLFLMLLSVVHAQDDFFLREWEPKYFSVPADSMEYTEHISGDVVNITVYPGDTLRRVLRTIFGNNLPAWRKDLLGNTDIAPHIGRLNIRTMRLPGGNWSNTWLWDGINHWDGSNQDGYSGTFKAYDDTKNYLDVINSEPAKNWPLTTDELLQICSDWGVEPQICVNYALARYIDAPDAVQQAAHYAAEWVRYVKSKGIRVRYWEIGNEHYGSWEAGYVVEGDTLTGAEYGADACIFIDSMKAADPDIRVGIVVFPAASYWASPDYTVEVLQAAGDKADFLILHDYFTWSSNPDEVTYEQILNGPPQIRDDYDDLQALVRTYTSRNTIPTAMTEYNYFAGMKETEGVALLFFARALGEYVSEPYGLVNYWDIQNGSGADDHGMFTYREDSVADDLPHPSFFPYYLSGKMFGDVLVRSADDGAGIHTYASLFSNGYTGVMVVNETGEEKRAVITLPGLTAGDTLYRYELYTPALSSRKIYLNGQSSPEGEWYGPRGYDQIAPYVTMTENNGSCTTGLRPYSVNFFVMKATGSTGVRQSPAGNNSLTLMVSPNPATQRSTITYTLPAPASLCLALYNLNGERIQVLWEGKATAGSHTLYADVSSLPAGIYILRLVTRDRVLTKKIMIH